MPYIKNAIEMPFIAKADVMKVGLNNLGNRNAAERLFTTLLPGMNNVTQRIRYYSFYCWLIKNFYIGEKEAKESQFRSYLRNAEFLLALIHSKNGDAHGIPGTTTANTMVAEEKEKYSITDGAEGNGIRKYWKYSNGILGQYYFVSMMDLHLVGYNNQSSIFYNITKGDHDYITGDMLANVFSESVGSIGTLFLDCIKRGYVMDEELNILYQKFNMHSLTLFPKERDILENLLIQADYPCDNVDTNSHTYFRRETIKYFLQYIQSSVNVSDQGYARYMYELFKNLRDDETIVRWYAYYLNEQWQFNCTMIFSRLLSLLKSKNIWVPVDELTQDVSVDIINGLGWDDSKSVSKIIEENHTDEIHSAKNAAAAFQNLIRLASTNMDHIEEIRKRCRINEQSTFSSFCKYLEKKYHSNIKEFIVSFVLEHIIYRHYIVSFIKQQTTGIASQKFILENDSLLYVGPYDATHTAPRVAMLANFLSDLCLIDNNNHLTERANNLLDRINK